MAAVNVTYKGQEFTVPRDSDEVVQMYVQHLGSAVTRPRTGTQGIQRHYSFRRGLKKM